VRKHVDGHWFNPASLRQFFDDFASKHNLDPLDEKTWYVVPAGRLMKQKVRLSSNSVVQQFSYNFFFACREAQR